MIDQNTTSQSLFSSGWDGGGLDGARELFANRVQKASMDTSEAISIAVKHARAVARSAQPAKKVHLCPRCVVPRIVFGHVWDLISDSRPGAENRKCITWWPRHVYLCPRYYKTSRTRSRPEPNLPKRGLLWVVSPSCVELPFEADLWK